MPSCKQIEHPNFISEIKFDSESIIAVEAWTFIDSKNDTDSHHYLSNINNMQLLIWTQNIKVKTSFWVKSFGEIRCDNQEHFEEW